jgi:hypothetical protein
MNGGSDSRREGNYTGKPPRFTVEQVIEALRAAAGVQHIAAQKLGCARSTITYYKRKHPEIEEALEEIKESLIDLSEGVVWHHVRKKNLRAAQFVLETIGKQRGWVKRGEIAGVNGEPIEVRLGLDLSNLSPEELITLDQLLARAQGKPTEAVPN